MGRGSKTYFDRLSNGEVLPAFRDDLRVNQYMKQEEKQRRLDARTDIMATILAAYPTTPTKKLAKEFNVSEAFICQLARQHGITKANGTRTHSTSANQVEKVDNNGKVVTVYESVNKAAKAAGVPYNAIRRRVEGKNSEPLDGFMYRMKKSPVRKRSHMDVDLLTDFYDDEEDFYNQNNREL